MFLQVGRHPVNRITDLLLGLHMPIELPNRRRLGKIPAKIEILLARWIGHLPVSTGIIHSVLIFLNVTYRR